MWKEVNETTGKDFDVALSFQDPSGCLSAWNLIGTLSHPNFGYQCGNHTIRILNGEDGDNILSGKNDTMSNVYKGRGSRYVYYIIYTTCMINSKIIPNLKNRILSIG